MGKIATEHSISRRGFFKLAGTAAAGAAISGSLKAELDRKALAQGIDPQGLTYVRSVCSPNCTGGCGIFAAVKDGQIKTLIQAADYPADEGYNPRGCLKGLSMMNLIYGPNRMHGPTIRTGEPGSHDFREVSWDEALDTAASKLREIADKYGPESIACIVQVTGTGHVVKGAISRMAGINGWSMHGGYDMNGDLPMSTSETFGCQSEENESYCWPDAKYILVFGSNLAVSRLPDMHFLTEARENGTKVVCFDPIYNATASKCDEWFSLKPSSDAAVALGMVKRIIDTNKLDSDFISTYTDLPFLIDVNTGKKLRADDVDGISAPANTPSYRHSYVVMTNNGPQATDATTLAPIDGIVLEGTFTVQVNGQDTQVKTGFTLLREELEDYTPEHVEELSEMPAADLVRIADEFADNSPAQVIYGASNYQWYHGDLKGRALALLTAVTGNIGKEGAGYSTYAGQYRMRFSCASWWTSNGKKANFVPFDYLVHGTTDTMNPNVNWPKSGIKAWIFYCSNPFDQHNLNNALRRQVEDGDLELVINLDFQQTTSSLYSHINLPGVSWYEKTELVTTPLHPYIQLQQKAVEPYANCKNELYILNELEKRYSPEDQPEFWPFGEDYDEATDQIIERLLQNGGSEVRGITLDQLRQGPVKMNHTNPEEKRIPYYDQIHDHQPFPPVSYPERLETTAALVPSGRMEFYRDEDTFIQLGETLPIHKPPFEDTEYKLDPSVRDKYKLVYMTNHTVFHVHSTHSNNLMMNELTDSKPRAFISPNTAAARGISDGDQVEVFNDRNTVRAWAVVDAGMRDDCLNFEEGWWNRYTGDGSYNALIYPFINPTNEVYFVPQIWSPNTAWNECLCDVRKVSE